ncbi:putative helix-loop-helix DNA binding protein [Rosellinia necatrix]|uniref:Putative helix-loop-helix DNA binding protein n=1 Tax=Rosellinia necatrix TaxID=77044 RepID=A0A1W2TH84_ROSNE|nr:putative helix-loop-helix DNA binding protein [Rosellinia necatrix]
MDTNGYSHGETLLEPMSHLNREHLAAVADAAVADHHHEYSTPAPSSPSQKRKRSGPDSSPDSRRSKRSVPTAAMSSTPDPSTAYVESAIEAAQAAAQATTNADFVALQQAAADRHEISDPANASSTAAAALGTMYPTLHVPQTTDATFVTPTTTEPDGHQEPPFSHHDILQSHSLADGSVNDMQQQSQQNGVGPVSSPYVTRPSIQPKLAVGSEEWHKQRKDNHKEVERRRRETINEGINELAKIVPGCEKNKGSILQRAVAYILQLKQNELQNIEKWTLEKLLTEQAIQELSSSNDKLKSECERAYRELTMWKNLAQNAGLELPQSKNDS